MKKKNSNQTGKRTGKFDSKFERELSASGIKYNPRNRNGVFLLYTTERLYYPDFTRVKKNGELMLIEAKGWFKPSDRAKMINVKKIYDLLDIRLVFQADNWLTKKKKQRYSDWAVKHGFKYAIGTIPQSWLDE